MANGALGANGANAAKVAELGRVRECESAIILLHPEVANLVLVEPKKPTKIYVTPMNLSLHHVLM